MMSAQAQPPAKTSRIHFLDNLRTFIILIVVLYHVGGVYEAAGLWGWFWIVDDPDTITWVGIVGIVFDIFVMPTMFFISGYLTPASLQRKSGWEFVKGKVRRLMIPWAIAVFTLIPLYKVIFLYSRGLPQEHWTTYFHFTNPNSQNWLWFLPVLFLFDMLFLLLSRLNIRLPELSLRTAVLTAFVVAVLYSIGIGGLVGFRSWTLTPLIDFENERLLVYFMAFLLGAFGYHKRVFDKQPESRTLYMVVSSTSWVPITVHILARLYPIFYPQGFELTPVYLLIWWLSFHLSLVSLVYLLVQSFWRYLDRTGRWWSELSRNSYGVYIIHVVVIGIFGTLLLHSGMPALVKYLALICSTYLASNLLVSGYRSFKAAVGLGRRVPAEAVKA